MALQIIFNSILILAAIVTTIVLIKILSDYKKYGKRIFKTLNTTLNDDYRMNLLIYIINSVFKDAIIIKPNLIPCNLIVLTVKNIYIINIFSCNEEIILDNNDHAYISRKKIINPVKQLNLAEFYINENLKEKLVKLIILDSNSKIVLKDNSVELVYNKDIRNRFICDKFDVYNVDQLKDIKNIINEIDNVK